MSLTFTKIPLAKIPQFSKRDIAYISGEENLRPFYKYPVQLEQFEQIISDKKNDNTNRDLLVSVLEKQYQLLSKSENVHLNIQLLKKENCFTVTTAHQPSLFTGPLYYIYKILSTIKLSEVLKEKYPSNDFVPVFVSGAEDHDFEEVNHALVFGKELVWQNEEKGPVGKMNTKSLNPVIEQLAEILGSSQNATQIFGTIKQAYQNNATYGSATIQLVHELFKQYGLVILDMSHETLKQAAIPLFREELLHSPSVNYVSATSDILIEQGYKAQATPRDINLFYLGNQIRERIVREDELFKVLNTSVQFSQEEILEELENHPDRFSPNVIMRPLFQELILPNLAYVGGGGEIAYWLERKTQFEHFGINFPMLIRRCSALIIKTNEQKKMTKLGVSIEDLFKDNSQLVKQYLLENADNSLNLTKELQELENLFEKILVKAKAIDPTLAGTVKAEESKQLKSLSQMEARFVKAEKRRNEQQVNQITNLQDRLFPEHSLQERKVNFLSFYLDYGDDFFNLLKEALNPLEKQFVVFQDS